ncbi:aspartate/glutamate racemase family protein [Nocardioides alcanivorans]|uniref:aspartate/glutamate racemase family protein n=1 Tax=Nocardioides alcanivorans TaxID=2897352 RepID=UPI001F2AB2BB|nr:aspartate/glutamate racemase family protein [Nocardioides alcanivorans]
MKLSVIIPSSMDVFVDGTRTEIEEFVSQGTKIDVVYLSSGPASVECEYDEALAAPPILQRVAEAAEGGADAVFITCFGDPGVHAARELVDIPVVGGFEPSILTALSLGERVTIITVLPNVVPMLHGLTRRYGLESRINSNIRVVDIPVLALDDHDILVDRLYVAAQEAIESDRADVIVLGCTGMVQVAANLQGSSRAAGRSYPSSTRPAQQSIGWRRRFASACGQVVRPT